MVPSRNQKDVVSVEYLLSDNMPGSILTWDGSISYGPSMNQTNLLSVEYILSGNVPFSTLTRGSSICYGPFGESKRSDECGVYTLWQYA